MNNLTNFNNLFSKTRLLSYNNDIIKHYDNLKLVGKVTPKIATLEIILRNKLDNKLLEQDDDWVKNLMIKILKKLEKKLNIEKK
ncbi:CAAX protease [Helicobacter sp. MIT 14-3879]|uniref:CAAX protease n=1 Tax=Helicobacter sp. MIT 14-3879 TaxID=2040649 RepID=UPI0015F19A0D|nr:CAAX protease [Helicobacter sp. MIT 14-3879]